MAIATDKVLIPILPINIVSINIILLPVVKEEVIPVESPTVPKADIDSNNASTKLHFSNISTPVVEKITITMAVRVIVNALWTRLSDSLLLNIVTWLLPLSVLIPPAVTAAKVVVFMPPAVLPGEAPINMRRVKKNKVAGLRLLIFMVLKPAVLGVTDWKKLESILAVILFPSIELGFLNSSRKKTRAPKNIKVAVTIKTIFACNDNCLVLL